MNTFSETEIEEAFLSARMHRYGVLLKQLWSAETLSEKVCLDFLCHFELLFPRFCETALHFFLLFFAVSLSWFV